MNNYLSLTDTPDVSRYGPERSFQRDKQGRKCYVRRDIIQWLTEEFGSLATDRLAASRYVPESQNQDVRPLTRVVALS